ncbi:MAG: MBG domain-containing protein [Candidatus Komeilibacteria bacterium]
MSKLLKKRKITFGLFVIFVAGFALFGNPYGASVKAADVDRDVPAENLILNPSLEEGVTGAPTYWNQGGYETVPVFTYPVEGTGGPESRAAKVELASYTSGDAKWYFNDVTVTPGAYYSFSDQYKATIATRVSVRFNMGGCATDWTKCSYQDIGQPLASESWQTFSSGFIVPIGATSVTVFHLIEGVGELTVDDFSLFQMENPDAFDQGMVSLAFDDGWQSIYDNGLPILDDANFKSTQYVITDTVLEEQGGYVTASEVLSMYNNGHDIASHSKTHLPGNESGLVGLSVADLQSEVFNSRYDLLGTSTIGVKPTDSLAYPYGQYDAASKTAIEDAGYLGARTVVAGFNTKASDRYLLKVQVVERDTTLTEVQQWIDTAVASKTWLILVFHQIDNEPLNVYGTTPDMLQEIVDYLTSEGVLVKTVSQALQQIPGLPATGDTVAPIIDSPADLTVGVDSAGGIAVDYIVPEVTDNIDTNLVAACFPLSGSIFDFGSTTVTCKAADTSGNLAEPVSFTVTVALSPVNQTITFNPLADKTYGEPDFLVIATASSGLEVSFVATGSCSILNNNVHITGAGSCTIVVQQFGDADYNPAPDVSRTFNVNKAAASVTLGSLSQIYDSAPKSATATTEPSGLTVDFIYDGSATTPTNAGSYAVVATINDLNYSGSASGTLVILPTTITITADAKSKLYGEADPALTYQITNGALAGDDAFSGALTRVAGEGAGTYAINQGTLALNDNYTLIYIGANLTISKVTTNGGGGGGGGGGTFIPSVVTVFNAPLVVGNSQTGTLTEIFGANDKVMVKVPNGAVNGNTTFNVTQSALTDDDKPLDTIGAFLINGKVYNITATDSNGQPVKKFNQNLIISISIPDLLVDPTDLGVYYFDDQTNEWTLVSGASFDSATRTISFSVNHLTKFAIFRATGKPAAIKVGVVAISAPAAPQVLGVTIYADGSLLRGSDKKIFIMENQKLRHVRTLKELAEYRGQEINDVSNEVLAQYQIAVVLAVKKFGNNQLIRGANKKIYVINNGKKVHILNLAELRKYAGRAINDVTDDVLNQY